MKEKSLKLLTILKYLPILFFSTAVDNDFYFLYKYGEYIILNKSFPHNDFLTVNNPPIVLQQWLFGILSYFLYEIFGKIGIIIAQDIFAALIIFSLYKLLYLITNKKITANCLSFLFSLPFVFFCTFRPLLVDILLGILMIYVILLYKKKNNSKVIFLLPIFSLLESNLHSSFLIFFFLIPIAFLMDFKEKHFDFKLFVNLPLMALSSLINPYGLEAVLYLKNSSSKYSTYIAEMNRSNILNVGGQIALICIILLIFSNKTKEKKSFPLILIFLGTLCLTIFAVKCTPFLIISTLLLIAENIKNLDDVKILKKFFGVYEIYIPIICIIILIFGLKNFSGIIEKEDFSFKKAVDYLEEIAPNSTLYTTFYTGNYSEFKGFICYSDARMETHLKKKNGVENSFEDNIELAEGIINYKEFLKENSFDYYLFDKTENSIFAKDVLENLEYEIIYEDDNAIIIKLL